MTTRRASLRTHVEVRLEFAQFQNVIPVTHVSSVRYGRVPSTEKLRSAAHEGTRCPVYKRRKCPWSPSCEGFDCLLGSN